MVTPGTRSAPYAMQGNHCSIMAEADHPRGPPVPSAISIYAPISTYLTHSVPVVTKRINGFNIQRFYLLSTNSDMSLFYYNVRTESSEYCDRFFPPSTSISPCQYHSTKTPHSSSPSLRDLQTQHCSCRI